MERSVLGEGEIPAWNLTRVQDQGLGDQTAGVCVHRHPIHKRPEEAD